MKTLTREQELKAQIIADKCNTAIREIIESEKYTLEQAVIPNWVRDVRKAAKELIKFNI